MSDISVKKVNKLIEEFEQEGNKVDRLEIGRGGPTCLNN